MKDRSRSLIIRWAGGYAAVECVMVVVASLVVATSWPWVAAMATLEGALLGFVQGRILRELRPHMLRHWTIATIAGVLIGRSIEFAGDLSPLAGAVLGFALPVQILAGAVLGALVGAASGSFQAVVLRGLVHQPARWIAICAAAWCIGLPALLLAGFATARLSSALPMWYAVLVLLGVFAAIGALTGAVEGAGLGALLRAGALRVPANLIRLERHAG